MTREELVKELEQLPLPERRAVVAELLRGIKEEVRANGSSVNDGQRHTIEEKLAAVNRLRGAFKTNGSLTDEELKEDYINYLAKKYS